MLHWPKIREIELKEVLKSHLKAPSPLAIDMIIPFLDLSQALSDPEETFIFDAGDANQLYVPPSQLQEDRPTIETDEQFFQPNVSFPELELCRRGGHICLHGSQIRKGGQSHL